MERSKLSGNVSSAIQLGDLVESIFNVSKGGYAELKDVEFRQEYRPETNLSFPIITYVVDEKVPGLLTRNTKEIKPRYREVTPDTNNPGYTLTTSAQVFDCLLQFDVYSPTMRRAIEVAESFERLMHTYTGILMEKGVRSLVYGGLKNKNTENWKDSLAHVTVAYHAIIEVLYVVSTKDIEEVKISITANDIQVKETNRIEDELNKNKEDH